MEKLEFFFTSVGTLTCAQSRADNFVDFLTNRAGPAKYRGGAFSPQAEKAAIEN